MLKYRERRY